MRGFPGTLRRAVNRDMGEQPPNEAGTLRRTRIAKGSLPGARDATAEGQRWRLVNTGNSGLRKALKKEYPQAGSTELRRKPSREGNARLVH